MSYRFGEHYAASKLPQTDRKAGVAMDDPRRELDAIVEGKSDEEILSAIREKFGGSTELLDETMAGMADALDPDAARTVRGM